jgi:hypothetical protein
LTNHLLQASDQQRAEGAVLQKQHAETPDDDEEGAAVVSLRRQSKKGLMKPKQRLSLKTSTNLARWAFRGAIHQCSRTILNSDS